MSLNHLFIFSELTPNGRLKKKHCIVYDIWQIRLLTYLSHPSLDKKIYDNLINVFDLPPLQKFGQIPENIWFLEYPIYLMTSLMICQLDKTSNLTYVIV